MTEMDINVSESDIDFYGKKENNQNNNNHEKELKRTIIVRENIENFSLDDPGTIKNAKKHRDANRPLHKIGEFTDTVNFCRCCNLPCEKKGIIEPFHFCDKIDKFSECGLGVTLYFYFFHFIILITLIGIIVLSIGMIIFNLNFSDSIVDICNNNFINNNPNETELGYCFGYIVSSEEKTNLYKRFNRWILRLSTDNIEVYKNLVNQFKLGNKNNINKILINYSLLNFCYLITVFILNIFFIIFTKAQAQKGRILNFSIKDYSVLISDAKQILFDYIERQPKLTQIKGSQIAIENGKEFRTFVNDYLKGRKELFDLKINIINLCYDLGNYIRYRDDYEKCKRRIFQVENNQYNISLNEEKKLIGDKRLYYGFCLYKCGIYCCHCCYCRGKGPNMKELKKNKIDLEKKLNEEQKNIDFIKSDNFTGYMLISFDKIKDKEIFLAQYPHNFFDLILYFLCNLNYYVFCCCVPKEERLRFKKVKGIDAYDPPEPEDIIWENFKYTERERGIRTIVVFLICIVFMVISLGCIFALTLIQDYLYHKNRNEGNTNIFLKYLVSFAITVVISIINSLFEILLENLTHFEKQISKSKYILSLSIKVSIFTFLNSAIVPLISKHLVLIIYKKYDSKLEHSLGRERNNLLIDDMLIYFIVNAIFTPLLWTLYIPYLIKKIQQYNIEKEEEPDKKHYMTQKDLNQFYLYPDMNLAYKYSYLIKTTAMCLFYMPIFPIGFFFSFAGFVFGYFLERYNFTHLYKRPEMLDEIITKVYAYYFIILLFIGGIGDYFFLYHIFDDNKWALINIIVFGILIIIPYTKFFNCNFVGIDKSEYKNYPLSEVYLTFYNDYQRQNPLTKRIGLLNYLSELKKFEYLSDLAYKIAEENIEHLNIMEIYYGISRGSLPLSHQSIIANTKNNSILSTENLVRSILNRGLLKKNIFGPIIGDNPEIKQKKKKFFDSQIFNMFGKELPNRGLKGKESNIDSISEIEKNKENDEETNDKLIDAYNNPLGINMGLGPLPLSESIYKKQ